MNRSINARRLAMIEGHLRMPPIVDFVCTVDGRQVLRVESPPQSPNTAILIPARHPPRFENEENPEHRRYLQQMYDQAIVAVLDVGQLWSLFLPFSTVMAAHRSVNFDPRRMQGLCIPLIFEKPELSPPKDNKEAETQEEAYIREVRSVLGDWTLGLKTLLRNVALEVFVFDFCHVRCCPGLNHPVANFINGFLFEMVQVLREGSNGRTRIYLKDLAETEPVVEFWQRSIIGGIPLKGPCDI